MEEAHSATGPRLVACLDLPPCRHCGGRVRWLNADLVPSAPWFMHCAHCSPPPVGDMPEVTA